MLNRNFAEMLSCFAGEAAEYLLVGAHALAAHGFVRATGDMDLWIGLDPENLQRVLGALIRFGAPVGAISASELAQPDSVLQIGIEPERIDILSGIDGVVFAEAWPRRRVLDFAGVSVPVIAKADLLRNKLASNRDKDAGDIAWLRRHP